MANRVIHDYQCYDYHSNILFKLVVESTALKNNYSTLWHLDYGIAKTLKLFIYLNPVSIHDGNTLIIDKNRTQKLRDIDELPIEYEKRKEDLTPVLKELGLDTSYLAYDYEAGDALLFSPLLLAHRRLPPKENQKRYTIILQLHTRWYSD